MSTNAPGALLTLERDPVCGMNVNPATARHRYAHAGKTYYFCCAGCAEKFKTDPQKYLAKPAPTMSSDLVTLGSALPARAMTQAAGARAHPVSLDSSATTDRQGFYVCPMCLRSASRSPDLALRAEWLWSPNSRSPLGGRSTPVPCIRKLSGQDRDRAQSAAWHWNRAR